VPQHGDRQAKLNDLVFSHLRYWFTFLETLSGPHEYAVHEARIYDRSVPLNLLCHHTAGVRLASIAVIDGRGPRPSPPIKFSGCGWPLTTWALQQIDIYLRHTGRSANAVAKAARDPKWSLTVTHRDGRMGS
jgi:hypothetical protein